MDLTERPVRPSPPRGRHRAAGIIALLAAAVLVASSCVMNGTWASLPAPVVPVQTLPTGLNDVSCPTTDWCMAVGRFGAYPLVEVWDGSTWSVSPAPPVSAPPFPNGLMRSIECGAPDACVAQIDRFPDEPEDFAYAVLWDGEQWHEVPPGSTIDGPYDLLAPSSCAPDGSCLIIVQTASLLVRWDGAQFATSSFDLGLDVYGIECFALDDCLVVTDGSIYEWDGTSFTAVPDSAVPFVGLGTTFTCLNPTSCVSFGFSLAGPVGLHWDGASWSTEDLGLPADTFGSDLSCGSTECVGTLVQGEDPTVVTWNGSGWYAGPALPDGLRRLSCLATSCVAVGSTGTPSVPIASRYTWTNP